MTVPAPAACSESPLGLQASRLHIRPTRQPTPDMGRMNLDLVMDDATTYSTWGACGSVCQGPDWKLEIRHATEDIPEHA